MSNKVTLILLASLAAILISLLPFINIQTNQDLISPLLYRGKSLALNQWFPKNVLGAQSNELEITSLAALFLETNTGQVLYSKNPHQKLPIASLVKIMTALIALENIKADQQLIVSSRAVGMEPDAMLLIAGERLTLRELLYGTFLISANDAAEVIAEGTTGSRGEFIKLMNDKAALLGMKDSHFVNPTGLDEDTGSSYSTPYDLAILTRYLIKNYPQIVEISKTPHIFLPQTSTHQDYDMYSGINLLTTYEGVVGFKTGFTPEAGFTLITLARIGNHEVVGILLNSQARRDEAKLLLDYSFSKLN